MRVRIVRLLAAMVFLSNQWWDLRAGDTATVVVDKLILAVGTKPEREVLRLREEVTKAGPEVVGQVAVRWSTVNDQVRGELTHAIGRIPGQAASELLVGIALNSTNRSVAATGLSYLAERAEAGTIFAKLDATTLRRMFEGVQSGDRDEAVIWAFVASAIEGIPQGELATSMVQGLLKRFAAPCTDVGGPGYISYLSPWVNCNSLFVRAAARAEKASMIPRLRSASEASTDYTERMWLQITRGRCGDPEVKDEVLRLVEDRGLEPSLRAEALRAYVGAAGKEAVPILLKYKDDQTREPAWLAGPPLRIVARSQLARLGLPQSEASTRK